jgi:hypothetical protein
MSCDVPWEVARGSRGSRRGDDEAPPTANLALGRHIRQIVHVHLDKGESGELFGELLKLGGCRMEWGEEWGAEQSRASEWEAVSQIRIFP